MGIKGISHMFGVSILCLCDVHNYSLHTLFFLSKWSNVYRTYSYSISCIKGIYFPSCLLRMMMETYQNQIFYDINRLLSLSSSSSLSFQFLCFGFDFLVGKIMLEHQLITCCCNFALYDIFANLFLKYT